MTYVYDLSRREYSAVMIQVLVRCKMEPVNPNLNEYRGFFVIITVILRTESFCQKRLLLKKL